MKVLGIGNALIDLLHRLSSDDLLHELNLPKGSMQLIDRDRYMQISQRLKGTHCDIACGGSAANTICGAAKLGMNVGYVGKVGKDAFGQLFRDELESDDITPHLFIKESTPSGCATTLISQDGERTFGTYLGAAATMNVEDIEKESFAGYDWVYVEGYLIAVPELIEYIMAKAKREGCRVAIDMASYNVVQDNLELFRRLIDTYVDMVFANEEEAFALTGKKPEEALRELAELCSIAVVKIGKEGSLIGAEGEYIHVPTAETKPIDTTGAGDLYAAGFLYGMGNGCSYERCAQIGSIVAGNVIEVIGTKMKHERWVAITEQIDALNC